MDKPRTTNILKAAGLIDFSMVRQDIMERACAFGSAVHKATELDDLHTLNIDTVSEPILPYLEGWRQFKKDYNLTFSPSEIEHRMVSKKYGFNGTPDRWHTQKGILVDIKSSTVMYQSTSIQTMAYQMLVEENFGIKITKRLGVQLLGIATPGGKFYRIEPYTEKSDKAVFLSCLNIFNWKKRKGTLK